MREFKNRVAVVTGAASGIGLAMAERFAAEGMKIVVADIEAEALESARNGLAGKAAAILATRVDVSKAEEVERLARETYEAFGAAHVLCNNAGVAVVGAVHEHSLADWQWVIGVNLWGVIHGVRSFVGRMLAGLTTSPFMSVYDVTKHGVVALSESACRDCADITSAFEGQVLGPILRPARAGLKMRMGQRPKTLPLLIDWGDGQLTAVEVPVEDYPAVAMFLEYPPPAYLDGRTYAAGISVCGQRTVQVAGPPAEEVGRRLGAKKMQWTTTFLGNSFERLIAKIAYAFVVADVGLEGIEAAYVMPAILGEVDDIGHWIGCDGMEYDPRFLHGVVMQVVDRDVIVRVRLFVNSHTPEYVVVVGRLTLDAATGKFRAVGPQGITRTRSIADVLASAQPAPPHLSRRTSPFLFRWSRDPRPRRSIRAALGDTRA
jgi:hypothetical protein